MVFAAVKQQQGKFEKSSIIMSEFSGCARALAGAFTVNPYDSEDMAMKIAEAVSIPSTERLQRMQ